MKILHIINTLEHGGAQSVLRQLLEYPMNERDQQMVVSLMEREPLSARIDGLGIPVEHISLSPGKLQLKKFFRLVRIIRSYSPDIIQTWLYHSDLIGSVAARLSGRIPIVWGVHHTTTNRHSVKFSTWMVVKVLSWLSPYVPSRIVCCSQSAFQKHVALGYPGDKLTVIQNGVDTKNFSPNDIARTVLREELGLPMDTKLIGMFARYNPQKDHETFFRAGGILFRENPNVHFVLAGRGITPLNEHMTDLIKHEGLSSNVHLLGPRNDIPMLAAGIDIFSLSSSYGEALPQAIGEAMACGTPCVATDIGDTAFLIGDAGIVVKPKKPKALASAWKSILELPEVKYDQLRKSNRNRIVNNFNSIKMVEEYIELYQGLV